LVCKEVARGKVFREVKEKAPLVTDSKAVSRAVGIPKSSACAGGLIPDSRSIEALGQRPNGRAEKEMA